MTRKEWTLEQTDRFPFDLVVRDAEGREIVSAARCATSSRQMTLADCMEADGFPHVERADVIKKLREQVEHLTLVAAAPDLYEVLEAIEKSPRIPLGRTLRLKARAALQRARGEQAEGGR